MGKLLDTLQRAGKSSSSAMGFMGRAATASKPKAAAIAVTGGADADALTALIKAGADIIIIPNGTPVTAAKDAGVAWGIDARAEESLTSAALEAFHEQGADFVILPQTVSMRVVTAQVEHLERVLVIAPPQDDPMLFAFRGYNLVEVDAVVLDLRLTAKDLASMTVDDFTHLHTMTETLRFPKFVTVQDVPAAEDVRTLAHLGGHAIWLANATAETVTQLREALEAVPREKDGLGSLGNMPNGTGR